MKLYNEFSGLFIWQLIGITLSVIILFCLIFFFIKIYKFLRKRTNVFVWLLILTLGLFQSCISDSPDSNLVIDKEVLELFNSHGMEVNILEGKIQKSEMLTINNFQDLENFVFFLKGKEYNKM